jgi:hypothetical protein
LGWRQALEDAFWQHQNRPENTEHSRLHESRGGDYRDRYCELHRRPSANGGADAAPTNPPRTGDAEKPASPNAPQNCRKRACGMRRGGGQRRGHRPNCKRLAYPVHDYDQVGLGLLRSRRPPSNMTGQRHEQGKRDEKFARCREPNRMPHSGAIIS